MAESRKWIIEKWSRNIQTLREKGQNQKSVLIPKLSFLVFY